VGPAGIHTGRGQLAPSASSGTITTKSQPGQANDLNDGRSNQRRMWAPHFLHVIRALSKVTKWQAQQVNAHHAAECRHCIIPEAHRGRCP